MFVPLISHPQSPPEAVHSVSVECLEQTGSGLTLRYLVTGDISKLVLAAPAIPERSHRLWQHSCFEIFLKGAGEEHYEEYNFSSSGAWAAYRFTNRRTGMADVGQPAVPLIECEAGADHFTMTVRFKDIVPQNSRSMLLGLSVIIEETSGCFSYWAIAHPNGPADFHHPDCFALSYPFEDVRP